MARMRGPRASVGLGGIHMSGPRLVFGGRRNRGGATAAVLQASIVTMYWLTVWSFWACVYLSIFGALMVGGMVLVAVWAYQGIWWWSRKGERPGVPLVLWKPYKDWTLRLPHPGRRR